MIVVDVNVLVAAHRADHPHHESAFRFLTGALRSDTVVVPDSVWSGFLRVVTHPRVFEGPSTLPEANAFVRDVVGSQRYRHIGGFSDGIDAFLQMCESSDARGALIPDAYIAAVALVHGCPVATFDRDFGRFDSVRVVSPQ